MTNNRTDTHFAHLTILARDCAASIADDLTFALSNPDKYPNLSYPFISDDRTDYNNAATDLLTLLMPALTDDDPYDACDTLFNRLLACDLPSDSPMRCIHDSALDFASDIFDLLPDDDDCPNFD